MRKLLSFIMLSILLIVLSGCSQKTYDITVDMQLEQTGLMRVADEQTVIIKPEVICTEEVYDTYQIVSVTKITNLGGFPTEYEDVTKHLKDIASTVQYLFDELNKTDLVQGGDIFEQNKLGGAHGNLKITLQNENTTIILYFWIKTDNPDPYYYLVFIDSDEAEYWHKLDIGYDAAKTSFDELVDSPIYGE